MPNKKKQQKTNYKFMLFVTGTAAILFFWFVYFLAHTPYVYCRQNPDKCVCEYTTTQGIQIPAKTELCDGRGGDYNFRKKTQAELDTGDCQNFGRERCIKSLPKTECKKGNPDWIEEIECDGSWYRNKETKICCLNNDDSKCSKKNIKTICREKTEAEKLMDKDCDELFSRILFKCSLDDLFSYHKNNMRDCQNYRQVWRQKGCSI